MSDFVFNIAKGRAVELYNRVRVNDPANSVIKVVVLATSGLESDAILMDKATLAAVLSGSTNEVTNTGYVRKSYDQSNVNALAPDNTNNWMEIDIVDAAWVDVQPGDTWAKILVCYAPDISSSDSAIVPLVALDCFFAPNNDDVLIEYSTDGFFRAADPPVISSYRVQPAAYWASDTATDVYILDSGINNGVSPPFPSSLYTTWMDEQINIARQWYWDNCDGMTFDVLPSVLFQDSRSFAQIRTDYPSFTPSTAASIDLFWQGFGVLDAGTPSVDLTATDRLNVMVTPLRINYLSETVLGQTNTAATFGSGSGALPCACGMWNAPTVVVGGNLGAYNPATHSSQSETARWLFAHELGHALGYDAGAGGFLPHNTSNPNDLMWAGSHTLTSSVLDTTEKDRIKASPFMRTQTRPT